MPLTQISSSISSDSSDTPHNGAATTQLALFGGDGAPLQTPSLGELADYLQYGYWDDTGGRPGHSFNMGATGTGANNGVLYYDYNGFTGVSGPNDDLNGLTTQQRNLVDEALDYYSEILGITFIHDSTPPTGGVDLYFSNAGSSNVANYNLYSSGLNADHRYVDYSWINLNASSSNINSGAFETTLHEIGHALGLGHMGPYNRSAVTYVTDTSDPNFGSQSNLFINDSEQVSMMSYFAVGTNTNVNANFNNLLTPMQADYIALQRYYGNSAFSGNTTYGFNTNITTTPLADLETLAGSMGFSIVDSGGIDTLDFSGFSNNQRIILTQASSFDDITYASNIGGRTGNMTIAVGTIIENAVGGAGRDEIRGNDVANRLWGNGENDAILGFGGNDRIYGGAGDDLLAGGDGFDYLYGEEGNDTLIGNASNDTLRGGVGDDLLNAGDGNDILFGNEDDDDLYGGAGHDNLYGGSGRDELYGNDGIDLLRGGDGGDNLFGGNGDDDLHGDDGNDELYGQSGEDELFGGNGNDALYGGSNADDLRGQDGNDILEGQGGSDTLLGGGGNDTLRGGNGNDFLLGGGGSDRIYGGNGNDDVWGSLGDDWLTGGFGVDDIWGGSGIDRADYTYSNANWIIDLDANGNEQGTAMSGTGGGETIRDVENLTMGSGNDRLLGTSLANDLRGGDGNDTLGGRSGDDYLYGQEGNDSLNGGGGDDHLYGGGGNDIFHGGRGNDRIFGASGVDAVDYSSSNSSVSVDLSISGFQYIGFWENEDLIIGVENITGSSSNDTLRGNNGSNLIYGLGGNDTIEGRGGNEVLNGGMGVDTASYESASQAVSVDLALSGGAQNTQGAGIDTLISFENLEGSDHNDFLFGDAIGNQIDGGAGDDWIFGREGNDDLNGGFGDDLIHGGEGNDDLNGGFLGSDTASYFFAAAGVNVDLSDTGWQNTGGAGVDRLFWFENLSGSLHDDDLTGDNAANGLTGGAGDDRINGSGGNDVIEGGAGADIIDGGLGFDTASYETSTSAVTVTVNGTGLRGDAAGDSLTDIENLTGSAHRDILNGDSVRNIINGLDDDDTIRGFGGNDRLIGGVGMDNLYGHAGNDSMSGGADADVIAGGAGSDIINGGSGNDIMIGGVGDDIFVFNTDGGSDRIRDWLLGNDTIDLSGNIHFNNFAQVQAAMVDQNNGHLRIDFDASNEILLLNTLSSDLDAVDFIF